MRKLTLATVLISAFFTGSAQAQLSGFSATNSSMGAASTGTGGGASSSFGTSGTSMGSGTATSGNMGSVLSIGGDLSGRLGGTIGTTSTMGGMTGRTGMGTTSMMGGLGGMSMGGLGMMGMSSRMGGMMGGMGGMRGGFGGMNSQMNQQPSVRATVRLGFQVAPQPPAQLARSVSSRLTRLPIPDRLKTLNVEMNGRTAVLRGTVSNQDDIRLLENILSLEPGIDKVDNQLVVSNASNTVVPTPIRSR